MRATTVLRELLDEPGRLEVPSCPDALSAKLAEAAGFRAAYLGGYAFGAATTITEPLTTATEMVTGARNIASRTRLPLIVDAGAGWGEPLHTMRSIRELITAGVAGAHLEDQQYPKRAHYHRDYQEQVASWEDMEDKFRAAVEARDEVDADFVLIGRTDSMKTHGYDEAIRRANGFFELGADLVLTFPNTLDEAMRAPRDASGPLVYVNSVGNRVGRPVLDRGQLDDAGYEMVIDAIGTTLIQVQTMREYFEHLAATGDSLVSPESAQELRLLVEELVGLPEHYAVEERTVQKDVRPN